MLACTYRGFLRPFMKLSRSALVLMLIGLCAGCASHSSKMIGKLQDKNPQFATAQCQNARQSAGVHDEVQNAKLWVGPSVLLLAGPLAIVPVFLSGVGLNTMDQMQANDIAKNCGGKAVSQEAVAQSVAVDSALSLGLGVAVPVPTVQAASAR
jgi:hypothetical protein